MLPMRSCRSQSPTSPPQLQWSRSSLAPSQMFRFASSSSIRGLIPTVFVLGLMPVRLPSCNCNQKFGNLKGLGQMSDQKIMFTAASLWPQICLTQQDLANMHILLVTWQCVVFADLARMLQGAPALAPALHPVPPKEGLLPVLQQEEVCVNKSISDEKQSAPQMPCGAELPPAEVPCQAGPAYASGQVFFGTQPNQVQSCISSRPNIWH